MLRESRLVIRCLSGSSSTAFRRFIAPFYATNRANASGESCIYPRVHWKNPRPHTQVPEGVIMNTAKRHALIGMGMLAAALTANLAVAATTGDEPRQAVVRYS